MKIVKHIKAHQGRYLVDSSGQFVIDGKRIPINEDAQNVALIQLLLETCNITLASSVAKAVIQRLRAEAATDAQKFTLQRFSALSRDTARLYVPLDGGELLRITKDYIKRLPNGDNDDALWAEHPNAEPLNYVEAEDPKVGLTFPARIRGTGLEIR
jgi:hypothetical protein